MIYILQCLYFLISLFPISETILNERNSIEACEKLESTTDFMSLPISIPSQGLLYRWTEHLADLKKNQLGEGKRPFKLHPGVGFFEPWSFIMLKNWHQDLSYEGSNFILSWLEVSHWAAQTQPFFGKLPEITDFGLLQHSQNRARFWIC